MDPRTTSPDPLISDSSQVSDGVASGVASGPSDQSIADGGKSARAPNMQREYSFDSPSTQSPAHRTGKAKPITLCVYTLKEGTKCTMTFSSGRNTTAQQIVDQMLLELGMPGELQNVFSIWLTSKFLQLQLKPYHLPCKLFKRWKDLLSQYTSASYESVTSDEPILSFQRNAFLTLKDERKLLDPKQNASKAIDLLFHEAVFNVIKSRYPMTKEELHDLAGLQATVKAYESFDKSPNPANYQGSLSQFYPPHMCPEPKKRGLFKQKSVEGRDTSELFTKSMRVACSKSSEPHNLKVLYLQICWHKPFYGSVFFKGQMKKPFKPVHLLTYTDKQVVVALNADCLHLFSISNQPETLLYLMYDQLSWEVQLCEEESEDFYSSLWVEFDSILAEGEEEKKIAKRIQIFSRQAPMMDAMISRCVTEIEKREEMLRQLRIQQGNQEFLPEISIKTPCAPGESPRVQRQERNFKEHKLNCEVYAEDGSQSETSGFTLSRMLKKKRGKFTSQEDAAVTVVNPLTQEEGTRLEPISRERSDSQHSSHSITTGL